MSDFFKSIQAGLNEAVEHQKNGNVKGARTHAFADIDIKKIRTKYDLSQSQFAQTFGLNVRNVQDWEQKRKQPTGASLVLLRVIQKNPQAVINSIQA
jgi:putative transcriptional regulator